MISSVIVHAVCDVFPHISNGFFTSQGFQYMGSQIALQCRMGYVLQGTGNYTCSKDGKWEGESSCSKITVALIYLFLLNLLASIVIFEFQYITNLKNSNCNWALMQSCILTLVSYTINIAIIWFPFVLTVITNKKWSCLYNRKDRLTTALYTCITLIS